MLIAIACTGLRAVVVRKRKEFFPTSSPLGHHLTMLYLAMFVFSSIFAFVFVVVVGVTVLEARDWWQLNYSP